MKSRSGFVSNSSSTSFLIDGSKYSVDHITRYIKALLDAENIVSEEQLSMDDICTVFECNADDFLKECARFDHWGRKEDQYIHKDSGKYGKCVQVDSTGDNSIPWSIQEALENIAILRQHWG